MPPHIIDSHCHLTYDGLHERISEVVRNAHAAGVTEMVTIATDLADARKALALGAAYPNLHVVCGIHPHHAGKVVDGWDATLLNLAQREDVHAVGEMGLDYHYDFSDRDSQHRVFRRQLEIATEVGKSVVIHAREAHADVLRTLAEFPDLRNVVFHCFTGTVPEAREILDRGYWISLTGVITFKKSDELREAAKLIPDDRLMVETDSPYLAPEPVRNARPNEPAHLVHTLKKLAEVRGVSVERIAALTVENTRRFFGLEAR